MKPGWDDTDIHEGIIRSFWRHVSTNIIFIVFSLIRSSIIRRKTCVEITEMNLTLKREIYSNRKDSIGSRLAALQAG